MEILKTVNNVISYFGPLKWNQDNTNSTIHYIRRYMAEILPIRRKLYSINQAYIIPISANNILPYFYWHFMHNNTFCIQKISRGCSVTHTCSCRWMNVLLQILPKNQTINQFLHRVRWTTCWSWPQAPTSWPINLFLLKY